MYAEKNDENVDKPKLCSILKDDGRQGESERGCHDVIKDAPAIVQVMKQVKCMELLRTVQPLW